jgi:hypothetical protein
MTRDRLDREAERLFDAARREQPSRAARERTLAAFAVVPRERRQRVRHWFSLAALAACLGAGLLLWRRPAEVSPSGIGPEQQAFEAPPTRAASAATPPPVSSALSQRGVASAAPSASPRAPVPAPSGSVGLERELEILDDARNALASGNAAQALALLDRHQALRGKSLSAEATLLRIQALASAGRADAAEALARSFIASNPNSLLADRARRFIRTTPEASPSGDAP